MTEKNKRPDINGILRKVTKRSVELPKITHLPKTTENHLENHIYRGIIPS